MTKNTITIRGEIKATGKETRENPPSSALTVKPSKREKGSEYGATRNCKRGWG